MSNVEQFFSEHLLRWYRENKRDLPWRRSKNPYHIWVSEVMLQQTRVETVIPYYHRFLDHFPTVEALADAPEEEVLKCWEGLGYYSRARNLQAAVRKVKEQYGGTVPANREQVSALKGVGPYTTGAILSIAYNQPEPAVDGNVMRVLSRFFLIEDDIASGRTRVQMEQLAQRLIPEGAAGDFNQALMEFGATVCTPRSPYCLPCPVMEQCAGRLEGKAEQLPVKKKAKPPRVEWRAAAFVEGRGSLAGKFLICRRPQEGLLARMWELPHVELPEQLTPQLAEKAGDTSAAQRTKPPRRSKPLGAQAIMDSGQREDRMLERAASHLRQQLQQQLELSVEGEPEPLLAADHTFSHIQWEMLVFRCRQQEGPRSEGDREFRWIGWDELEQYAFPNVFVKMFKQFHPQ